MLKGVADFWVSRVVPSVDAGGRPGYVIKSAIGPDEWHRKDEEAYTTAVAQACLQAALLAADVLRANASSEVNLTAWRAVADGLTVPLVVPAQGMPAVHQLYQNYSGEAIMQPGTIDIGYPLMYPMNASTRRADLGYYWQKTSGFIASMVWPAIAIGYNEINDTADATLFTAWSYSTVQPPFNVVTEEPGGAGCPNFITGSGGVLSTMYAGWGGMRLRDDSLDLVFPRPPPESASMRLDGVAYLGWSLDVHVHANRTTVSGRCDSPSSSPPPPPLRVSCDGAQTALCACCPRLSASMLPTAVTAD